MRTTIANRFNESLESIQRHSRKMADEQVRISGGTKMLRASDSPLTMGRAVDLRTTQAQLDALGRLQAAAANRMAETEAALADAGKVLDDFYQLYVVTQNASLGKEQLKGLGSQAAVFQEELKQILRRTDAAGYRIFNTSDLKVIVDGGTAGVEPVSVNTIGVLEGLNILNPDANINWSEVKDSADLDAAVESLLYGDTSRLNAFVKKLVEDGERYEVPDNALKEGAQQMTQQRIRVGASQARVDRSMLRTDDLAISVSTALSREVDTDFAESTMEAQKARALLEAAQSITAQIGTMNLFQRIG